MLPEILIGPGSTYKGPKDPTWLEYLSSIGNYARTINQTFLSQICFEHGKRFNEYFPDFNLEVHQMQERFITALDVQQYIRYDRNEPVDFWASQFDKYYAGEQPYRYHLFEYMVQHQTWLYPPVIIENSSSSRFAQSISRYTFPLGQPWHLVEGTHRVSYLNRMLELDLIAPSSRHKILCLVSDPLETPNIFS